MAGIVLPGDQLKWFPSIRGRALLNCSTATRFADPAGGATSVHEASSVHDWAGPH